jgi:large conductance mechanosensitive channel
MLKGFRDFILRGNVVDLAVAVIIGTAFGAVVTAFTKGIVMQFVAAIVKTPDFDKLAVNLNGTPIQYGPFLTATLNFLIVAGVIYFFVVLPLNYLLAKFKGPCPRPPQPQRPAASASPISLSPPSAASSAPSRWRNLPRPLKYFASEICRDFSPGITGSGSTRASAPGTCLLRSLARTPFQHLFRQPYHASAMFDRQP